MKKILKVLVAIGAVVGGIAGVMYFLDKRRDDDFDDFDDMDFDDVFEEEEDGDDRDYVTLDFGDGETEE